jgi:hypothetical protein
MIVYWYSFSNHYTRECIHTCERERTCGSSQSSPGFVLAPSLWCRHASHAHHPPSPPCLVSSQAGFGMQCYSPLHARWPQCVYRGRVQAGPVYLWSSLHAPPRLHRQLMYTYGFSPHNLTTFRFRLWRPSAPAPPPEASTAVFSSAFSPSRRSFLPPPVPLLHYSLPRMRSHDVASAAARLGSPNHLDTPWVTLRLGLDPQYESSPPPSRSFAGGRLLPPSLLTYAYTSNPRCARPLGLAARLPSSPHTVICPYFCAKYALNTVSCASRSLLAIRCRRRSHLPSGTSSSLRFMLKDSTFTDPHVPPTNTS